MKQLAIGMIIASTTTAQLGWTPAAPTNRASYGACSWCDTSVTPNEVYTMGGAEDGVDPEAKYLTVYCKQFGAWSWRRTRWEAPPFDHPLGKLTEWWHGKGVFATKNSRGETLNTAVCISSFMGGGLTIVPQTDVWLFKRMAGFIKATVTGALPGNLSYFSLAYVPYEAGLDGSGKIYLYGGYDRSYTGTRDMFVLDHVKGTEWRWSRHSPWSSGATPGLVHKASLVWHEGAKRLFLTGGRKTVTWAPANPRTWECTLAPIGGQMLWLDNLTPGQGYVAWFGATVVDPKWDMLIRFGGASDHEFETFRFLQVTAPGLRRWYLVSLPNTPGDRAGHSMVYMPSEQQFLMWGGWQRRPTTPTLTLHADCWVFKSQ